MAAQSDGNTGDGEIYSLKEFTDYYDLPKWVEVVGGDDASPARKESCNIQKGMILMLRTLAVENVTLSFNDTDTGIKRIVQVSPDTQVKFKVLLPSPDFKNPKGERTVYSTVADLLKVCPTYFKANVFYDDPYLPAIVKSGEVFRFIRKINNPKDRRAYMQCEDSEGNIIELPSECRGDFTAIEDDKSYSVREILQFGIVDRKLKLSHEHMSIAAETETEEAFYTNLTHTSGSTVLQRIMGLPLTYKGFLSLHKPAMFLAASPSDNLQNVWKIPLDLKINVKNFEVEDYERPTSEVRDRDDNRGSNVCKMFQLNELLDTFLGDFPILATIVHYKDMPVEFKGCLEAGTDVVIHNIERCDKILAKSDDVNFVISRHFEGRFRKILKKFDNLEEMKLAFENSSDEVNIKVLQDVASDFPVSFSLNTGDNLRFKTFQTKNHKVKFKSKSFGVHPVIHCERQKPNGSYEKIILPEDLEVCMHELPPRTKAEGFTVDEVFRFKPELPLSVDFLADCSSLWTCLPISSEIVLSHFITDSLAIVSPVSKFEDSKHIEPKVRDCLLVPARHQMVLTVKECLGFPPGYFLFPERQVYLSPTVEKISKQAFDELIQHNDMAYEDYQPESPQSTTSDVQVPQRRKKSGVKDNETYKRLSVSLGNLLKPKGRPNFLNKLRRKRNSEEEVDEDASLAVGNELYQTASEPPDIYDDDNIYEAVELSSPSK